MRTGLFFLWCWLLCLCGVAQQKDSAVLKPVTVYGLPDEKYLAGSSLVLLDSTLKAQGRSRNLSEILALQLPIYFRTYGNGMLSGISMRGTSPQHTSVLWNGINITSFSLGQADFSILPATAFDEIKIHEGAGSARFGSGAFGGTVLLSSTSPSPNNFFSFTQDVGSFGRYFSSANSSWSKNKFGFKTKLYNLSSENNFPVLLTGERQPHAAFRQSGILQDVEYRWSSAKVLSLHYWYHNADRDIQPTISQYNSLDNQQDRNQRLSIRYQSNSRLGLLSLNGGFVSDVIVYNGSASGVSRWIASAKHELLVAKTVHMQFGADWNHIVGNIPNYENGRAKEDRYNFMASVQKNISERFSVALNLRQPVISGFRAPFLPYLGMEYLILKTDTHNLKLSGNISKNYRVPTLNDRYWQNAGNKYLLPEVSHAGEVGINYRFKNFEIHNALFSQKVEDWIQWIPDDAGNYRPKNIQQVLAQGMEVKLSIRKKINRVMILPMVAYQYTKSVTTKAPANEQYTVGKQLIYTPQHTASGYVRVVWKKISVDISAQYNGKRYTDSGNSEVFALPAVTLLNASVGKSWSYHQHQFDLRIAVKNMFNLDYQFYAGRAMPGRNYNFQITYQLNPKHN